ncbi:PREDICTED: probable small intestine urate exporter [Condylura cristata]|uniref:probable small intestine urate exporter n=1 Tax=Condylura cristata TaxID=143302 RepID=UPI000643E031|nr:PREDICTED: probable small intestine urate exporter [Condylura cristata]
MEGMKNSSSAEERFDSELMQHFRGRDGECQSWAERHMSAEGNQYTVADESVLNMAQEQTFRRGFCSVRYGLAFILLLCNIFLVTQQLNLSITMPAMVNHTALNASTEGPPTDTRDNWNETLKEPKPAPLYDWNPKTQGLILSALNYGSLLAPIPTGYVAGVFGAKYVVGAGLFISSVLTLFTPLAADAGAILLLVLRIFQGIAQVMVSTGQYSIWVKWAPPMERSQLVTIALSGIPMGAFTIFAVGGVLCQTLGWPYVFYIFGGIGCACSFLWLLLVYEDPVNHPFISPTEKEYIVASLVEQGGSPGWSVPLKAMVKSLPLWAILVSSFTIYWRNYMSLTYTPTFMNSELQLNIRDSGIMTALPFLIGFPCLILGGQLVGFLLSRKILRLNTIRKLFTAIAVLIPTGLYVSLEWVRSSHSITLAFLLLAPIFRVLSEVGVLLNMVDIAPRYSAFLKGLSQVFSFLAGAISPTVSGYFINQDPEFGWRNVFFIAAAVDIAGLVIYLILGRAEVQDWASGQHSPTSQQA